MRSLVLRLFLLAVLVFLAIGITASTAAREEHFHDLDAPDSPASPASPDSPEARAEAAAGTSEAASLPDVFSDSSDAPPIQLDINTTMFNGDSMYAPDKQGKQGMGGDPLFRLLSALALESLDRDAHKILERAPSLPQVTDDSPSVSQSGLSTDQSLRQYLNRASEDATDWKSLAEHALQERDMYRQRSENLPPPAFTSNDLVLDPTQRWRVPERRAPVCIVSDARAAKVCPGTDQSSLIGTLLTDARHTSVGSIMPKFEFHQLD